MSVENEKRIMNQRKWKIRGELRTYSCKTCHRRLKEKKGKAKRRSTSLPKNLQTYRIRSPQTNVIPTHFLAFAITDEDVLDKVKEVRDEIESNVGADVGRLEPQKMPHVTLQVMKIKTDKVEAVEAEVRRLCKETLGEKFAESAQICNVGAFHSGNVVMAETRLPLLMHKLRLRLVRSLIGNFKDKSIGKLDEGAVKLYHDFNPHVTIAKAKRERPKWKIPQQAYQNG